MIEVLSQVNPEQELISQLNKILKTEDELYRKKFTTNIYINTFENEKKSLSEINNPQLNNKILSIHKLLFLTGGVEDDVVTAIDFWGNRIYTKLSGIETSKNIDLKFREENLLKEGEIQEARSAISSFIVHTKDRMKKEDADIDDYQDVVLKHLLDYKELPEVLSEIGDIFWNITNINQLDKTYNFEGRLKTLSRVLGFSYPQTLLLAQKKYHRRCIEVGKKEVQEENEEIAEMIRKEIFPIPTLGQLSMAAGEINKIRTLIELRLKSSIFEVEDILGIHPK